MSDKQEKNPIVTDQNDNQFELHQWHCPICESSKEKFIGMRGGDSHRFKLGVETRIVQCRECSLMFSNPFPIPLIKR